MQFPVVWNDPATDHRTGGHITIKISGHPQRELQSHLPDPRLSRMNPFGVQLMLNGHE
jgi:hypothetical protein